MPFYIYTSGTRRTIAHFNPCEDGRRLGEPPWENHEYFLQKANRCFEIGRECMDLAAARKINELGNEFLSERRDARLPLRESDRDFTDFR